MRVSRAVGHLLGDALREAGVLVVVFYGLGALVPQGKLIGIQEVAGAMLSGALGLMIWWLGVRLGVED